MEIEPISLEISPNLKKFLEENEYYMELFNTGISMIPKEYFGEKE